MAQTSNETEEQQTRIKQIGFKRNQHKKSNQTVEDHFNRIVAIFVMCQSANASREKKRKEMKRIYL